MNFELYSTRTIKQINSEVGARFQEKATKARPEIDGFVEKGGAFHLTTSAIVMGIRRTTRLRAVMERSKDVTLIQGYVSDGVQPEKVYIVMGALGFIGLTLILKGQAVFGVIVMAIAIAAYIPLVGDYNNSQYLMRELKRLTGAREKPPTATAATLKTAVARPKTAAKPKTTAKTPPRSTSTTKPGAPKAKNSTRPVASR